MSSVSLSIINMNSRRQCEGKVELSIIGNEAELDIASAKFVCLKDDNNHVNCTLDLKKKEYFYKYLSALYKQNETMGRSFNTKAEKFCISVNTTDGRTISSPIFYLKLSPPSTVAPPPVLVSMQPPVVQSSISVPSVAEPRSSSPKASSPQIQTRQPSNQAAVSIQVATESQNNVQPRASISTAANFDTSSNAVKIENIRDSLVPFDPKVDIEFQCLCLLGVWKKESSHFEYCKIDKPSFEMQCRVLRIFHQYSHLFIKVQYQIDHVDETVERVWKEHLMNGFVYSNEKYYGLGYSNSGVKESSLWFINVKCPFSREQIYSVLGSFVNINEVGKLAKRVGAPFGNSKPLTAMKLIRNVDFADIEDNKTDEYNFTDGCGVISSSLMSKLLEPVYPELFSKICAIQIRLHGYKGVLVRYPDDFVKKMAKNLKIEDRVQILLRSSMKKFVVPDETLYPYMDLCRISSQIPAGYNRQMTSILEYGMTQHPSWNTDKYEFISNRLVGLVKNSTEPDRRAFSNCNFALRQFTNNNNSDAIIRYLLLSAGQDDEIVKEPYIQSKIFKVIFDKYWTKIREAKPRTNDPEMVYLIGAVDETKSLKKNQVFVSFGNNDDPTILTKTVLIARNPCSMASDIRKVEAVYCKELSHLRNVIIFPQPSEVEKKSSRPLADECSGGDFDGDLYACIFNDNIVSAFKAQDTVTNFGKQLKKEFEQNNEQFIELKWDNNISSISERMFEHLVLYKKKSQVGMFEYKFRIDFEKNRDMKSEMYTSNAKRYALELEGALFKKEYSFTKENSWSQIDANCIRFKYDCKKAGTVDPKKYVLEYRLKPTSNQSLNEIMFCETFKFLQTITNEFTQIPLNQTKFITWEELRGCWNEIQYKDLYAKYEAQAEECFYLFNQKVTKRIEEKTSKKNLTEEEEMIREQVQEMEVKNITYSYDFIFPIGSPEREYREKYFSINTNEGVNELQLKAGIFYLYNIKKKIDHVYMMPYAIAFDYLVACRNRVKSQPSGSQNAIQPLIIDPKFIGSITKRI